MDADIESALMIKVHGLAAELNRSIDPARYAKSLPKLKSALDLVAIELGLGPKEAWQLTTVMNGIFSQEKAEPVPLIEQRERTRSLLIYLKSTASHKAMDSGLDYKGKISPAFVNRNQRAWARIPKAFRVFLKDEKFEITLADTPASALPDYVNKQLSTDKDDDRDHILKIHGLYVPKQAKAYTSEFFLEPHVQASPRGHELNAKTILNGDWSVAPTDGDTLFHETAHGFDHAFNHFLRIPFSLTKAFSEAYKADVEAMGGYEKAREKGYTYYVRKDEFKSQQETYAELQAIVWGAKQSTQMRVDFPNCSKLIVEMNAEFTNAHKAGLTSLMLFFHKLSLRKEGTMSFSLDEKWKRTLRQKEKITKDDIQGWLEHAPKGSIAAFAKQAMSGRQPERNDRLIFEFIQKTDQKPEQKPHRASVKKASVHAPTHHA